MTQVFARYAKDLLERQTYPEIRRSPNDPPEQPYDVTAWSLGMLFGIDVTFIRTPPPASLRMTRLTSPPEVPGRLEGSGSRYTFGYSGADTAIAINRLLKKGARVAFEGPSQVSVTGASRDRIEALAKGVRARRHRRKPARGADARRIRPPISRSVRRASGCTRRGPAATWTKGGRAGCSSSTSSIRRRFTMRTSAPASCGSGSMRSSCRISRRARSSTALAARRSVRSTAAASATQGVENLIRFVADGGTLIALGAASDLALDRLSLPVRNIKRGLRRDEHFAPGTILRLQVDTSQPAGYGLAADTYGFYTNGPILRAGRGLHVSQDAGRRAIRRDGRAGVRLVAEATRSWRDARRSCRST